MSTSTDAFDESIPTAVAVEVTSSSLVKETVYAFDAIAVSATSTSFDDSQTVSSTTTDTAYSSVPPHLKEILNRELEHDEGVLHTAMPKPRFLSSIYSKLSFGCGIIWTSSMVWNLFLTEFDVEFVFFVFFILLFIPMGLLMLAFPFWEYRNHLNTIYVITDRRVITFEGKGISFTIRSFLPKDFTDIIRREYQNGTGDVHFFQEVIRATEGGQQTIDHGFQRVQNAREIEAMLRTLKEQVTTNTTTRVSDLSDVLSAATLSTGDPLVPPQFQEIVDREIDGDERVLRTAMKKFQFRYILLFNGLYLVTLSVSIMVVLSSSGPMMFVMIPCILPVLFLGLFIMSLHVCEYRDTLKTLYVITDRRVIRICGQYSYTFPPYHPEGVFRREYRLGTGDVVIAQELRPDSEGGHQLIDTGFFRTPNAKDIEKMLKALAEQNSAS